MKSSKSNQSISPTGKDLSHAYRQCTGTRLRNGRKGCIDFLFAPGFESNDFLSEGACCRLYQAGLSLMLYIRWVLQDGDKLSLRYQLTQQFKPFAGNRKD